MFKHILPASFVTPREKTIGAAGGIKDAAYGIYDDLAKGQAHERLVPTSLDAFDIGAILGTGSFGRVPIARHRPTGRVVAIKILSKAQIVSTKQVTHVKAEKEILSKIDFPFIVKFLGCSQDVHNVHLILEYVVGGEFFTHLRTSGRFPEDTARFYAAEVVVSFEYLHSRNIIYRDLKPENLLIDRNGHLKITDFGFAKEVLEHRTYTLCGTPDYLAPEIILNKGHGKPVDWWALGVLMFEMVAGFPPFNDDEPWGTYQKILNGKFDFPPHFGRSLRDLIKVRLLSRAFSLLASLTVPARASFSRNY